MDLAPGGFGMVCTSVALWMVVLRVRVGCTGWVWDAYLPTFFHFLFDKVIGVRRVAIIIIFIIWGIFGARGESLTKLPLFDFYRLS